MSQSRALANAAAYRAAAIVLIVFGISGVVIGTVTITSANADCNFLSVGTPDPNPPVQETLCPLRNDLRGDRGKEYLGFGFITLISGMISLGAARRQDKTAVDIQSSQK